MSSVHVTTRIELLYSFTPSLLHFSPHITTLHFCSIVLRVCQKPFKFLSSVRHSAVQHSAVWCSTAQYSTLQFGAVWCGVVWCGSGREVHLLRPFIQADSAAHYHAFLNFPLLFITLPSPPCSLSHLPLPSSSFRSAMNIAITFTHILSRRGII